MIRSNLCDCSDVYILVSGTRAITGIGADDTAKQADERNKGLIFKNYAPFTGCINNINNTQIDKEKDVDVVMPMFNLIEYGDDYSKTSESLWQYYRDDLNDNITQFDGNTKNVEIAVPIKYLSNFWKTLEMPLIKSKVSLLLTWSKYCVISSAAGKTEFVITDLKQIYVPVVTLSTEDNIKLLKLLESGFKRTINWNKYQSKLADQTRNRYLDYLIDPRFQVVNRLFVLSFENKDDRTVHIE